MCGYMFDQAVRVPRDVSGCLTFPRLECLAEKHVTAPRLTSPPNPHPSQPPLPVNTVMSPRGTGSAPLSSSCLPTPQLTHSAVNTAGPRTSPVSGPLCQRLETLAPRIVHAAHTADLSKARDASSLHSAAHTADLSKARNASTSHTAAHTITVGTTGKAIHSGRYPIAFPCLY